MTFLPTSLAKADDPSHFQMVMVHAFKCKKMCPWRAMIWYLRKTEELRGQDADSMNLLRCMTAPFNPPSAQTVSRWIIQTIKMAYNVHPDFLKGKVKAHSVRALAPNWALSKGATKRSFLQAADWRRENTFLKHYAWDLTEKYCQQDIWIVTSYLVLWGEISISPLLQDGQIIWYDLCRTE